MGLDGTNHALNPSKSPQIPDSLGQDGTGWDELSQV